MSLALNTLVGQQLIWNERDRCAGLQGTYILEPAGMFAAGQALGLSELLDDLQLLKSMHHSHSQLTVHLDKPVYSRQIITQHKRSGTIYCT